MYTNVNNWSFSEFSHLHKPLFLEFKNVKEAFDVHVYILKRNYTKRGPNDAEKSFTNSFYRSKSLVYAL